MAQTSKPVPDDGTPSATKYKAILTALSEAIKAGKYKAGQRLPSEAQLSRTFGVTRLTVARALNELEAARVISRRPGSGSYVTDGAHAMGRTFGLLIPELGETEIFEPICHGMARARRSTHDELLWGAATRGAESRAQQALELCDYYIQKDVSGVFFAPLEHTPRMQEVNRSIVEAFEKAGIPTVLLDRDLCEYPDRSRCDLVGIDNRRAGYIMTRHLLEHGARKIIFAAASESAPTVGLRARGYKDAMERVGGEPVVSIGDPESSAWVSEMIDRYRPEAFVCANDRTAGHIMVRLDELGIDIPSQIRIVGIDDVKYASLLRVPLTTLRQPCHELGTAAISAMIERIEHPTAPARDILLDCHLVVRKSCGTALRINRS